MSMASIISLTSGQMLAGSVKDRRIEVLLQ